MNSAMAARADYGVDAPKVVRNLFVGAALGLTLWVTTVAGLWSGHVVVPMGDDAINFNLGPAGLCAGLGMLLTGSWMVWSSKVGKINDRERLLDLIPWNGNEHVLDLGCGRGLMLIGAAKRLTTGKATGVDIWQAEDLSGNRPEAALENARREGVENRVGIETADMRKLPFPDGTFDVVVSRAAIHNLYSADERVKAISEVARVLKSGGHALIEDIRHHNECAATFTRHGCVEVGHAGSRGIALLSAVLTMGSIRPGTLLVRKST